VIGNVNKKIIENVFAKFYSNFKLIFIADVELLPPHLWGVGRGVAIGGYRGGGYTPSKVSNSSDTTKFILKKPYIKLTLTLHETYIDLT
jgi:hypothetical protein